MNSSLRGPIDPPGSVHVRRELEGRCRETARWSASAAAHDVCETMAVPLTGRSNRMAIKGVSPYLRYDDADA
ncbi:hypothetical protein RB628_40545, partial [Streptomyces sp. ADMS]|uniref:hypothetical protein n=1 Tax=Streptomyces sp. ADMS TaxID=3071415 RepID=UPI00296F97EE